MIEEPVEAHYVMDTSALIDGLERFYPPKSFPRLWEQIDELISGNRLHIPEDVWIEAGSTDDVLGEWCKAAEASRDQAILPLDTKIAKIAGDIVQQFPKWMAQGRKNSADPFVIASAECNGWFVVSGEINGGPGNPKIPFVCGERGVKHLKFVDIVLLEGWVFG